MTDYKSKKIQPGRQTLVKKHPYQERYFAEKHKIPLPEARKIIQEVGGDRDKANRLAEQFKKSVSPQLRSSNGSSRSQG